MKPIMNLDEVEFDDIEDNGYYTSRCGRIGAHQIINTGTTTMRYLALSNPVDLEACEYPDSNKVSIVAGAPGERGLRKMFRAETMVEYYDRESTEPPSGA